MFNRVTGSYFNDPCAKSRSRLTLSSERYFRWDLILVAGRLRFGNL
jgi:hypothetical protein